MTTQNHPDKMKMMKNFSLATTVASALREAAFREDLTQSHIVESALSKWLIEHEYLVIDNDQQDDTAA